MLVRRIMVSATVTFAVLGCSDKAVSTDADLKIVSLSPASQSVGVDPNVIVEVTFSNSMPEEMANLVTLHEETPNGHVVAGAWEWSTDHRTLRFAAQNRLQEQLRYHLHLGGGIADVDGHPLNFEHTLEFHHAAWCDDTGSMHQFMNTNQWRHQNGMFGVFLEFTTGS